jgi:hypothetical protein
MGTDHRASNGEGLLRGNLPSAPEDDAGNEFLLLTSACESYLRFLERSVNVGPLTNNPTREAMLLTLLRDRTAKARAALTKATGE